MYSGTSLEIVKYCQPNNICTTKILKLIVNYIIDIFKNKMNILFVKN